jgi:PKD repeat protein
LKRARLFWLLALAVLGGCGGGGGGGGASTPATQESAVSGTIAPNGGSLTASSGVQLSVPAGAVQQPTTLSVSPVAEVSAPALPTGGAKVGTILRLQPHGTTFSVPVTLRVPFDPALVPAGASVALFKAQPGGTFVEITPVTIEGNTLVVDISSFSYVTVMAKPAPTNRPPVAMLNLPSSALRSGQTLVFSSANSSDPEAELRTLRWDFGDGSAVQSQSEPGPISHVYAQAGVFTVTLTAEDAQGLTQTASTQVTVDPPANVPPAAVLTAAQTSTIVGKPLAFSAVGSVDSDGSIARFDWDFGDGTRLERSSPEPVLHTFASGGRKTVRLSLTDDRGATATATQEIQVRLNASPVASIAVSGVRESKSELGFLPTGSADSDGDITRYQWDFGDGSGLQETTAPSRVTHTYANAGRYTARLTVVDNDGASNVAEMEIDIAQKPPDNVPPSALVSANISGPVTGQEVVFNPSGSTDADGTIAQYSWDFGDGSRRNSTTPDIQRHRYNTAGTYSVELVVQDNRGDTGTYRMQVSVQSYAPTGLLNDTGLSWCSNLTNTTWTNFVVCAGVNWLTKMWGTVQDALFGRDAQARANTLNKTGAGAAGFDFTKLGPDGQPLAAQTGTWSESGSAATGSRWDCVRDNNTGLFWEVKRNDPLHLRHQLHEYTWYNTQPSSNGGASGREIGGSCTGLSGAACNTEAYVAAVNALPVGQALCGFRDWRLPTREELRNMAHSGANPAPAVDAAFFPNTALWRYWWSASSDVSDPQAAWGISFTLGDDFFDTKSAAHHVRLVRSGL